MRVLIDTHVFLWMDSQPALIAKSAGLLLADPKTEVMLSVASIWELSIKAGLGRLELRVPLKDLVNAYFSRNLAGLQPLTLEHVLAVQILPSHHRDPFDRLLIAQCHCEKLPLISADPVMDKYGIERVWN